MSISFSQKSEIQPLLLEKTFLNQSKLSSKFNESSDIVEYQKSRHSDYTDEKCRKASFSKKAFLEKWRRNELRSTYPISSNHLENRFQIKNLKFFNWNGKVQKNLKAFYPRNKKDLINFIKEMLKNPNFKIRASGFRHSFSNLFSEDSTFLVSLLPESVVSRATANFSKFLSSDLINTNEFFEITNVGQFGEKSLVKIGGGVTSEQLRRWSLKNNLSMPANVIMTEVTLAGTNATISHGAGLKNKTLADLVFAIEFVNPKGFLQSLNKIEHGHLMPTAAGALGLMGIVVSLTLELVPQQMAHLRPLLLPIEEAIPPPEAVFAGDGKTRIEQFNSDCVNKFYCQWLWLFGTKSVYLNHWNVSPLTRKDPNPEKMNMKKTYFEGLHMSLGGKMQNLFILLKLKEISFLKYVFEELLAKMGISFLPKKPKDIVLSEALHSLKGLHNFKVRICEIQIAIPLCEGQFDFDVCRTAFWTALRLINSDKNKGINIGLEMRLHGGSEVTIAMEFGNSATCALNFSSMLTVPEADWRSAINSIWNTLAVIKDKRNQKFKLRIHWGKEWEFIRNTSGVSIIYFLADEMKEQIEKFKADLCEIGKLPKNNKEKWSLQEAQNRFSNPLLDTIIFQKRAFYRPKL